MFRNILQTQRPNEAAPIAPHPTIEANSLPIEPRVPTPVPPPTRHSMTTKSQTSTRKSKQPLSFLTSSVSPIPTTHQKTLSDPNWNPAMTDEYDAQINNKTCSLVPRPVDANIVNSMWLFKNKHDADGTLTRYKARLVANGKTQEEGKD